MQNENENVNVIDNEGQSNSSDLIETIAQLKKNTVSRELYEKEKAEKKEILQKVLNNESITETEAIKESRSLKDMAAEYFDKADAHNLSNREAVVKALEYRDKYIQENGESADPFVRQNEFQKPTQADYMEAQNIADGLQYLVDNSETDEDFAIVANKLFR